MSIFLWCNYFKISECCKEYPGIILKINMNPNGYSLYIYHYFQNGEWENLRSNSDNNDVVLAAKGLMDKNCLETNVIACFNLYV